mmetsp:Transcript_85961/g.191410  ORF Transcript_85961/g.191410 Transcript_85961/m.191410 type:complete len:92 (-) Transcript_85961:26-301(-)
MPNFTCSGVLFSAGARKAAPPATPSDDSDRAHSRPWLLGEGVRLEAAVFASRVAAHSGFSGNIPTALTALGHRRGDSRCPPSLHLEEATFL